MTTGSRAGESLGPYRPLVMIDNVHEFNYTDASGHPSSGFLFTTPEDTATAVVKAWEDIKRYVSQKKAPVLSRTCMPFLSQTLMPKSHLYEVYPTDDSKLAFGTPGFRPLVMVSGTSRSRTGQLISPEVSRRCLSLSLEGVLNPLPVYLTRPPEDETEWALLRDLVKRKLADSERSIEDRVSVGFFDVDLFGHISPQDLGTNTQATGIKCPGTLSPLGPGEYQFVPDVE